VLRDIQGGDLQVAGSYTYRFSRKASMGVRARQAPGQNSVGLRGNYRTENGVRLAAELQDGDWGTQGRVTADVSTRWGDARMEASQYDGQSSVSGSVAGALFIDHKGIAFGRPAYSSYVVVDVPGQAGIPVRVGGSPAGVTNAQGRVLVTNVSGLLPTEVSLKDKELPMGVEIGETKKSVTAPRQGGVRVTFPVLTQNARAFTVTGKAIPPGSMATTSTEQAVVGFDGALYLEHPEPGQTVEITDVCKGNLPSPLTALGEVNVVKCN
jgi:outer membrane usher protein FimD/PapC